MNMFYEWNKCDLASEFISIGPDNKCDRILQAVDKDVRRIDCAVIENVVLAVMPDGSFIKPEGSVMSSFETPNLAYDGWMEAFKKYIKEKKEEMGEDIELSWRMRPTLDSCSCGKTYRAWGYCGIYQKLGVEWEFKKVKQYIVEILVRKEPKPEHTFGGEDCPAVDYKKEALKRHILAR